MTLLEATMPRPHGAEHGSLGAATRNERTPGFTRRRRQRLDVGRIAGVTDPIACNRGDLT